MKTLLPLLVLAAFIASPVSWAADDAKPPGEHPEFRRMKREKFVEDLPPDVRARFRKVREQALQDPEIKKLREQADTANREFFKAVREKMIQLDPELAQIIRDKAGKHHPPRDANRQGQPGFGNLTEAERAQLAAAREKAKNDPAVQAAEEKKKSANSPQERMAASEEYRKAMHAATLAADPTLRPILDKLGPARPPARPQPGGEAGPPMMDE